jgi:UDP-3-O-acyl-N-acetylglucosamine deacetylase
MGLHSGKDCVVTVSPSQRPGIYFSQEDERIPLQNLQADGSGRGTTVTFPDGRRAMTVEHLLGVLSGLGLLLSIWRARRCRSLTGLERRWPSNWRNMP